MKPLYICDIDGTVANSAHRQHLVEAGKWDEFFEECDKDPHIAAMTRVLRTLRTTGDVYFFTARPERIRKKTAWWLRQRFNFPPREDHSHLWMREDDDSTSAPILKVQWYQALSGYDKERLVAVFEDDERVVRAFRDIGVACFHVADREYK